MMSAIALEDYVCAGEKGRQQRRKHTRQTVCKTARDIHVIMQTSKTFLPNYGDISCVVRVN